MEDKNEYNIVVADSHPVVIQGLVSLFKETSNFNISGVAHSGKDLRILLEQNLKIDTIFIDLKLPNTNIYRLIKDLVVAHSYAKIIAFTNYTMPKLVQDIMEFGVHAYLSKNATLPEILESIERVHNGEHFISNSVYRKDSQSKIEDNDFALTPEENFVKFAELTERELDVVILLSRGYTNKEIAEKLFLSKYTIETHRKNIMKKCKLRTVGQLIYLATQQGLL